MDRGHVAEDDSPGPITHDGAICLVQVRGDVFEELASSVFSGEPEVGQPGS